MKALRINLVSNRSSVDWNATVDGARGEIQKAAVNILTRRGSDATHSFRGTILQEEGANGLLVNPMSAAHSLNFAALETRQFMRSTTSPTADLAKQVSLELDTLEAGRVSTNLFIELDSGETFGEELQLEL